LQLAELSIAGHIITHSVQTRTSIMMVCEVVSRVTLPLMRELSPLLHHLPKIKGGYFQNSSRILEAVSLVEI
jgi:hypothetical protein